MVFISSGTITTEMLNGSGTCAVTLLRWMPRTIVLRIGMCATASSVELLVDICTTNLGGSKRCAALIFIPFAICSSSRFAVLASWWCELIKRNWKRPPMVLLVPLQRLSVHLHFVIRVFYVFFVRVFTSSLVAFCFANMSVLFIPNRNQLGNRKAIRDCNTSMIIYTVLELSCDNCIWFYLGPYSNSLLFRLSLSPFFKSNFRFL